MTIKHHIEQLERLSNKGRVEYIKQLLNKERIPFTTQPFQTLFVRGENIIVDYPFDKKSSNNKVVLSAHSNKFLSSPGANDNASGVSVLLHFLFKLKKHKPRIKDLRIIFFDREDGGGFRDGSKAYIKKFGTKDLKFVLNVDSVGMGDMIIIEGIEKNNPSHYFQNLKNNAQKEGFKIDNYEKPYYGISSLNFPLFVSDHTTFLLSGFKNACSITTDFQKDDQFRKYYREEKWFKIIKARLQWKFMKSGILSYKWKHYHNKHDISEFIEEETLQKVFNLVWNATIK